MTEFIGSKISLISRSDIRYVGILHEINSEASTVALEQVRSFGTEGRRGKDEVPPSDNVFEYIVFRGSDVKDLKIEEAAKKVEPPPRGVPNDPAILTTSAPPPRTQQSPVYPPMHQYPPPPPGYGNYQYPPPPFGGPGGFRPPPQHMSPPQGYVYPPPGMPPPRAYGGPSPSLEKQQQQLPPQPPQSVPSQLAAPPSPVKETKPDVATATAAPVAPAPAKPIAIQATSKQPPIAPAMPIPISIPAQPRTKPAPQPAETSPVASHPVVADTAKVTTAADVQSLAKDLSETKISARSAPGAGGYLTHQPRRRQFGAGGAARPMDRDFDFESANAKFNKEEVKKQVAAAGVNGSAESTPTAAQLTAALTGSEETFYDSKRSFFDNISCENRDRNAPAVQDAGAPHPNTLRRAEERKLNMETFGQASIDYGGGRYGRGGYRGGRGFRGGRGGGYYNRGGRGGGNPWRGVSGQNGQSSSEATA